MFTSDPETSDAASRAVQVATLAMVVVIPAELWLAALLCTGEADAGFVLELLLSAVTGFEIAVKYSFGKLGLKEPPEPFIHKRIQANALIPLAITIEHTMLLADLPFHHRDPFDRLLVAQALSDSLPILSADALLSAYGIERIW